MYIYGSVIGGLAIVILIMGWFLLNRSKRTPVPTSGNNLIDSLRDERQKSSIILSAIEDGVVLIDKQGIIQSFNSGAATITGWPADEANGLDYRSVIRLLNEKGEPYPESEDPLSRLYNEKQTVRDNTALLLSKNEKQLPIAISVSPLLNSNKEVSAAVAVFRDMTQERLEEKQRTEFISTASHEMRTPVAAIEGYLALALNEKVATIDVRARGYLEKAHDSTQHLGKLFQDLLTSAKAEDGRLISHPVVIDLGEYLEKLVNDLRFAADKKGLSLDFNLSNTTGTIDATQSSKVVKPLYFILADPDRLREVITNLFDNAVKYTEEGKVTIGLTGDEQIAQLYLKDTGVGIPSEDIPHLFQKFYRVDNSATRTIGGTGLGLYICRKIVELYQGKIWVESELHKGSTFFINFPRIEAAKAEQLKQQEAAADIITPLPPPVLQ